MANVERFWAAYSSLLGVLEREPQVFADENGRFDGHWHASFSLARHGRGHDDYQSGSLRGVRGDCIQIPVYSEFGKVGILESGFHKGDLFGMIFPFGGSEQIVAAAVEVIALFETR